MKANRLSKETNFMLKFLFRFIGVLIFQILISSQLALASMESLFFNFYYSPEISSLHCGRNISLFMKSLSDSGVDISDVKILSITAGYQPWSFGRVIAVNSRWGTFNNGNYHQNWDFHVIAIHDKKVYDFSFNQTPLVLSVGEYLESMFIPKQPFAINGETFRVGSEGPLFNANHARMGLDYNLVKVMRSDKKGKFTTLIEKQNMLDYLRSELANEN